MANSWWIAIGLVTAIAAVVALLWRPYAQAVLQSRCKRVGSEFRRRRELLELKFFQQAAASGKPRGLRWTRCDFEDDVHYARHRISGEFCAFVGVTIGFEAIEGGPMEDVEAVGNLRAATAVFRYRRGEWKGEGRVMFNLDPLEAIRFYGEQLEPLAGQLASGH